MNSFLQRKMLRIFVIVIIANAAMAQVPIWGPCPNLETIQNFELDRVSIETIIRVNDSEYIIRIYLFQNIIIFKSIHRKNCILRIFYLSL